MKSLLSVLLLLFAVVSSPAAETPESAATKIGETVEMVGEIVQVSDSKQGAVFLNFGGRYPNQVIYGYVSSQDVRRMGGKQYLEGLEGKTVELKGKVELWEGKPQIVLKEPKQIDSEDVSTTH